MKPYEFKRIYHPSLGRFVYQHKGSGIIVDNIFKPFKWVASKLGSKAAKEVGKKMVKKTIDSAASEAGDRLGKKIVEKSGDLIQKRLKNKKTSVPKRTSVPSKTRTSRDAFLEILQRGDGIKRKK